MDVNNLVQTVAIYALPVLFAITLHEAAHGYVARYFGDMTAHAQGRISLPAGSKAHRLQRRLLEEEGVVFRNGRVDLGKSGGFDLDALLWRPRAD